jgi:sigma-E factor negative regulatory protein RseC
MHCARTISTGEPSVRTILIAFKLVINTPISQCFQAFIEKVIIFDQTEALTKLIAVNSNMISHTGTIKSINNQHLIVKIISETACASCHAKGACSSAEQSEKEIEVRQSEGKYAIGEQVLVVTSVGQGYRALLYAYLLPLILLVTCLIALLSITKNEATAAVGAIICLAPYYSLLWLFRHKIQDSFHFIIQKQSNLSFNE